MPVAPKSPQFPNHPIPGIGEYILSAANALAKGVVNGTDVLLVAPPSADDVDANGGSVARQITAETGFVARVTNAAGLLAADSVSLVYKAEGGREVVLDTVTGGVVAQGAVISLFSSSNFFMSPTDLGLFIRLTEAVPATGSIDGVLVGVNDVRGPSVSFVDVTATEAIAAAGGNPNNAQTILENEDDDTVLVSAFVENPLGTIFNYDGVAHTYQLFITDGTTVIEISDTAVPPSLAANSANSFAPPTLPPGWSLKMSIDTTNPITFAPRVCLAPVKTNVSAARDDQAGAF